MALAFPTSHLSLATLLLLLVLPTTLSSDKETVLPTYYIVENFNETVVPVAGIQGQRWSPTTSGSLFVVDLLLGYQPSLYSPEAGRVEGIVAVASVNGTYNFQTSTTRFTNGKYKGSSLNTKGVFSRASSTQVNEFAIEGGTGVFERAKGIGYLTLIEQTPSYTISNITYKLTTPKYKL